MNCCEQSATQKEPGGRGHAGDAGQVARAAGEEQDVVRGAERPAEARDVRGDVAAGALAEDDGLGAVLLLDVEEGVGDEVDGLVPADALPLVLAAVLRVALHRVEQAVLVVGHLGHVEAADAQAPLVVRVLRVALDLDELPVLVGVEQHAAAVVAAGAGPRTPSRDGEVALLVPPRLLMGDLDEVADELSGYAAVVVALHAMFCHVFPSSFLV